MMTRKTFAKWFWLVVLILASGCGYLQPSMDRADCRSQVPDKAEEICPILIGQSLPRIVLRTADNAPFDLNAAVAQKPTVLIFFRGGWCPYCSLHLGRLQSIESQLVQMGFQIIAVSPDRPGILKAPAEKQGLKYRLLSDSEMTAAKALGIAFRVDDTTVKKYKTDYGIDLEGDSGQIHHLLPVP